MSAESQEDDGDGVRTRGPEAGVALFLMVLAGLVIYDSLRVGAGWGDDGPKSGYFPFYIGLILFASSGWVLLTQLLRWSRDHEIFVGRAQLRDVFAMLWPITVYVALIAFIGIYVASAALIAWFMLRHGKYRWVVSLPVAVAVPLLFFLVFERWFLVPLPKGPLERLLGF